VLVTTQPEAVATEVWDDLRWSRILDRIDHRQVGIGLRFWGPPLWLEVTMAGPDSDRWWVAEAIDLPDHSWNWESANPCFNAMQRAGAGADDESLLQAASRYTFENLVLNAVHEVGEWLRFDARRVFPAHGSRGVSGSARPGGLDGHQGNGAVYLRVNFDLPYGRSKDCRVSSRPPQPGFAARVRESVSPWRFTYLPHRLIAFTDSGPLLVDSAHDLGAERWASTWSRRTRHVVESFACAEQVIAAVQGDVHRMLVDYEVDQICRAFHVDGRRPFRLARAEQSEGIGRLETAPLPVSIDLRHELRRHPV
jgi:hypothetical protein